MDDEAFADIDPHALHLEWMRQPRLVRQKGEELAEAKKDLAFARDNLKVVAAEVDRDIRLHPLKYGFDKVTEKVVEVTVLQQTAYREAFKQEVEAGHLVNLLDAQLNALEHKKKALENLVSLHLSGYYSDPKEPEQTGLRRGDYASREAFGGSRPARR